MSRPARLEVAPSSQISTWERVAIEDLALGDEILTGDPCVDTPHVFFSPVVVIATTASCGTTIWCVRVAADPVLRRFPARARVVRRATPTRL